MSLSIFTPIMAAEICNIICYKDLKVYCLQGIDGSEVVIKVDNVDATQIKAAGHAVKAVDPSVKMKLITASEKSELVAYCQYVDDLDEFFNGLGFGICSPLKKQHEAVALLKESLKFPLPFAKMTKQTIHNIEDAAKSRGAGSKDIVRTFVSSLKETGGLEQLGRIVASDLFNGNSDRFWPDSAGQKKVGPFTFKLRCAVNLGNIMLISSGAGFKATALDYVDPNAKHRDIAGPLAAIETKAQWKGRLLADRKARRSFADDIVHDLEEILNPKKGRFSFKSKLGSNAASRVDKGLLEGARMIKTYLNAKSKPLETGLADRLAILQNV
jgi:hypothetical protein